MQHSGSKRGQNTACVLKVLKCSLPPHPAADMCADAEATVAVTLLLFA